jgi:hypothetical protein
MKIRFKKSTRVVFRGTLLSPDTKGECELPKALNNEVLLKKLLSRFRFLELVDEESEGEVPESDTLSQSLTEGQEPKSDEVINPESTPEIDEFTDVAESESETQDSTEESNPEVESETQDSTEESAEGEVESKE